MKEYLNTIFDDIKDVKLETGYIEIKFIDHTLLISKFDNSISVLHTIGQTIGTNSINNYLTLSYKVEEILEEHSKWVTKISNFEDNIITILDDYANLEYVEVTDVDEHHVELYNYDTEITYVITENSSHKNIKNENLQAAIKRIQKLLK